MHPEDVVAGWKRRRTLGTSGRSLVCDTCATELPEGANVVAETLWQQEREGTPEVWEKDYLKEWKV